MIQSCVTVGYFAVSSFQFILIHSYSFGCRQAVSSKGTLNSMILACCYNNLHLSSESIDETPARSGLKHAFYKKASYQALKVV